MNMLLCRIVTVLCMISMFVESSPVLLAGPRTVEVLPEISVTPEKFSGNLGKDADTSAKPSIGFSNRLERYNDTHVTYLLKGDDGVNKSQVSVCEALIGLVILYFVAWGAMTYLCHRLGMTNKPPPPPPPTPGPSMTNGPPTNASPDTNATSYGYLVPPMFGIDTNGVVEELSGIAIYQIVDSPSSTNEYGIPYMYYAVYTLQSSTDLAHWTNRCSVKEWVTGVDDVGYQYVYTALYDPNGNVIQAYPLNLPVGSAIPPMTNSFLDGIFQRDGPQEFYRFAAY